jgi:hypothetical protein
MYNQLCKRLTERGRGSFFWWGGGGQRDTKAQKEMDAEEEGV